MYLEIFSDPIQNQLSARSTLLKAAHLETLLFINHIDSFYKFSVYHHFEIQGRHYWSNQYGLVFKREHGCIKSVLNKKLNNLKTLSSRKNLRIILSKFLKRIRTLYATAVGYLNWNNKLIKTFLHQQTKKYTWNMCLAHAALGSKSHKFKKKNRKSQWGEIHYLRNLKNVFLHSHIYESIAFS